MLFRPILILGLVWQIIKIQLLSKISFDVVPGLQEMLDEENGEVASVLSKLPPESILLRWVNYHLKKAQSPKLLSNFGTDLMASFL